MPSRHSKNATSNTVYTYHERRKDAQSGGYGTQSVRLAKDSVANWDYCSLTLQPCRDAVLTPNGYLFDREAILRYMLEQKNEIAKKLKEYDRAKRAEQNELADLERAHKEDLQRKALSANAPTASATSNAACPADSERRVGGSRDWYSDGRASSFWVPDLAPSASKDSKRDKDSGKLSLTESYSKLSAASGEKSSKVEKPDEKVRCPLSGAPLSMRDLIPVHFTPLGTADSKSSGSRKQHVCAATGDLITNSTRCCVLRPSGRVVTLEYVNRIVKSESGGWRDPVTGDKLTEADIIELRRGGTGFAAVNSEQLNAKRSGVVLNC